MPSRRSASSSPSTVRMMILPLAIILLLILGVGGTLWGLGFFDQKSEPISREGQIAFPALARPVRAYDAITRDDLINPQTGQLNVVWIAEESATPNMLRDIGQILGRVVTRDREPGFILTESNFLPKGTRPGISAGIPPGKRSVTVEVSKVPGLELLRQGDVFDLMAVLPQREEPESNVEQAALLGGVKPPDTRSGQLARQTGIKPLVIGGTMVAITQGKSRSTDGAQGLVVPAGGSRNKTPQVLATVAVDPVEVAPLTEAMGLELNLYCVARSGHPDDIPAEQPAQSLDGLVPVVALARPVEAYSEISQEDLADLVTGRLNLYYFPPEKVQPNWISDFSELHGRVLKRDLSRGAVIQESDLMPKGTLPGMASAAPDGMSVIVVESSDLPGIEKLTRGNVFAVYQALPSNQRPAFPVTDWATLKGGVLSEEDAALQRDLQQGISLVVDDLMVLQPTSASSSNGTIALNAADVARFTQALNSEVPLYVAARTGERSEDAAIAMREPSKQQETQIRWAAASSAKTPEGYVSVPVTAQTVKAWSKLKVEHFVDPSTGRLRMMQFPESQVAQDWQSNIEDLIDRVVTRDIDAGRVISRSDLAAIGSQAGPSSGIPEGYVGIHLLGDQVSGLDESVLLQPGDRFQINAVQAINLETLGGTARLGLSGGDAIEQAQVARVHSGGSARVMTDQAILIEISDPFNVSRKTITTNTETKTDTLLTASGPVRSETKTSEPVIHESVVETRSYLFAVREEDVNRLNEALATDVTMVALPLRGVPNSDSAPRPAPINGGADVRTDKSRASEGQAKKENDSEIVPRPRVIEHIRGNEVTREVWTTSP